MLGGKLERAFFIMTRLEKCELAIEKGFLYNQYTGNVIGIKGKPITKKCNKYIALTIWKDKKRNYLFAHQFAWYFMFKETVKLIDHKNGIKTDNRISNLRSFNHQMNALNANSKGYYFDKRSSKFETKIMLNGKNIYIGKFDTEEEASNKYNEVKSKIINQN